MAEHGEPWSVIDIENQSPNAHAAGARGLGLETADGKTILLLWPPRPEVRAELRTALHRIVVCVNCCEGLSDNDVRTRTSTW